MLDELFEFQEISKVPPKLKPRPSVVSNPKIQKKTDLLDVSKEEIIEEPTNINININKNRRLTLGDKILLRKREEEEKKRKAEIIKNLHKNKKMNLHQFLTRVQNYEQKKRYNLELKKYQQLQKETESIQEKPKLSYNTLKICQTMPKEPLYKRTNEVLEEHENELKNLTIFYTMPKETREKEEIENNKLTKNNKDKSKRLKTKSYSVENTRYTYMNDYDSLATHNNNLNYNNSNNYILNKKNSLPKKMSKQQSDEFFDKQEKWLKNKRVRNQYFEKFYQIQSDAYSNVTFRPYVSQATLEILDIKNRLNTNNDEIYKYHIPNSFSQYNNLILNKGRTIWDKLYEEASLKNNCCEGHSFKDFNLNNNIRKKHRFKYVSSKFFDIYTKKDQNIDNKNKRRKKSSFDNKGKIKKIRVNKSFDDKNNRNSYGNLNGINSTTANFGKGKELKNKRRSFFEFNDINDYNYYKMKKEKEKYHWRNSLLRLKPIFTEPNDNTYHLNIMQSGAWNDNYVNKITLNDNIKSRSVINLII